jgi:hypothetical protein
MENNVLLLAGGIPALHPERKGMLNKSPLKNWVEKHGGLPTYINSVATALLREHPEWGISRIIATAVNWAKKTCATGKAFGGRVSVSKAVQAAACAAVASWEKKKLAASDEIDAMLLQLVHDFETQDGFTGWPDGDVPEWAKCLQLRKNLRASEVVEKDIPKNIRLSDELFLLAHYEIETSEDDWQGGEGVKELLDSDKFLELAEAAAYKEALVRFPVLELASEAKSVGDNLYKKVVLRNSVVTNTKGQKVRLDGDFMKALKQNFDELVASGEYVPLQFVKDDNKHTDDPRYYGGQITELELDDGEAPTCLTATFKLEDEAKKVVDAQPKVGVSIGANYLTGDDGRPINPVLRHVALSHRVKVKGMGAWQRMIAASDYGDALTVDLTDADVTIEDIEDTKKGGKDMAEETTGKFELTDEILQEILASDAVKGVINTQIEAATTTLKQENESLRTRMEKNESETYSKAVELAVDAYANKGVPKVARDLVQGLLLTFEPSEGEDADSAPSIELTTVTGEGDEQTENKVELSRFEAAVRLLEEFEGFVNMSKESGSSEDVELSDDATLQGDARKAAIAFLQGKAKA